MRWLLIILLFIGCSQEPIEFSGDPINARNKIFGIEWEVVHNDPRYSETITFINDISVQRKWEVSTLVVVDYLDGNYLAGFETKVVWREPLRFQFMSDFNYNLLRTFQIVQVTDVVLIIHQWVCENQGPCQLERELEFRPK